MDHLGEQTNRASVTRLGSIAGLRQEDIAFSGYAQLWWLTVSVADFSSSCGGCSDLSSVWFASEFICYGIDRRGLFV
ncbi:hypothetical protein BRARA_I02415 [Brassica rapa]|uniref:Uncharacterized protein n=1 Tax=Brassica campestris TaxID=3711 RepID=A0A397XWH7_BRACM|nr:hypothetical protein BRARA_I02415 [Brassica rapa]